MAKKFAALFLIAVFGLFNVSCVSSRARSGTNIGSVGPREVIASVVTKSGQIIDFRKNDPGRVVPGAGIVGRVPQSFDINRADIGQIVRDDKGKVLRLTTKDGTGYTIASFSEEGDPCRFEAYVTITIPFSDVQQVWTRRDDTAKNFFTGAGVLLGAAVIVSAVALISFTNMLAKIESCPFVYSWNGEEYVLDAEPYGAAISEGLKRTDWVELSALREVGGKYRLLLANELDETDYTDELKIVAVDHPPGVRIAPDLAGNFHAFSDPLPPVSAVDQTGRDILAFVRTNDRAFWLSDLGGRDPGGDGEFRDELVFEFPKPAGAKQVRLLANVWTTQWGSLSSGMFLEHYGTSLPGKYEEVDRHGPLYAKFVSWVAAEELAALKVWVETPGGWKARAMIMGGAPVITKDKAYALPVGDIPGETLRVKLRPPVNFWMINSLAVDHGEEPAVLVMELAAEKAVDHAGRDVRAVLAATDATYLESPNRGERTELVFAAPPLRAGLARTLFVKASGYYRLNLGPAAPPRLDLAERILTEPGYAARYSFREYLKWEAGVRADPAGAIR